MQDEANAALDGLEEERLGKIDFAAPRPSAPPPRAPMLGKNEEEMTMAEKAAQVDRLIGLAKDRLARTEKRVEEAKKAGETEEAARLEAIAKRIATRQGELERRAKILKGEPVPPEAASSGAR